MKFLNEYKKIDLNSPDNVFDYLLKTMRDTIKTYDYYVAWDKITKNITKIEVSLNIMNTLIGKKNISDELKRLIKQYPEIVSVIPILIACRNDILKIADIGGDIEYSFKKQKSFSTEEIDKIVYFANQCGLLNILMDKSIKNLVDYCLGVEVGLDTNARKNRSGTVMENLTEFYVKDICKNNDYQYISQATVSKINSEFNRLVPIDKSDRHFDFAINTGRKIYLVEVNYYSGGGSKLKAVAGEFKNVFKLISKENYLGFIWVTDGQGWNTAKRPLRETFDSIDFLINLNLIEKGLLEKILIENL